MLRAIGESSASYNQVRTHEAVSCRINAQPIRAGPVEKLKIFLYRLIDQGKLGVLIEQER
jgi:hypothetical protein